VARDARFRRSRIFNDTPRPSAGRDNTSGSNAQQPVGLLNVASLTPCGWTEHELITAEAALQNLLHQTCLSPQYPSGGLNRARPRPCVVEMGVAKIEWSTRRVGFLGHEFQTGSRLGAQPDTHQVLLKPNVPNTVPGDGILISDTPLAAHASRT